MLFPEPELPIILTTSPLSATRLIPFKTLFSGQHLNLIKQFSKGELKYYKKNMTVVLIDSGHGIRPGPNWPRGHAISQIWPGPNF